MEDTTQKNWTLGSTNTNYKTSYDPSLLVRIDRYSRRKDYEPMFGYDLWTCFEVNFLSQASGLPEFHVIKVFVDCNSPYIFESKSFKLYLFSFNNTVFKDKEEVIKTIEKDLNKVTGLDEMGMTVFIQLVSKLNSPSYFYQSEVFLESLYPTCKCEDYHYNPDLLRTKEITQDRFFVYYSDLGRSNCEQTLQPDLFQFSLAFQSKNKVGIDEESLLRYLVSYRLDAKFHEPTVETLYQDLLRLLNSDDITVMGNFTRRGGVSICPIRSSLFRKPTSYNISKGIQH